MPELTIELQYIFAFLQFRTQYKRINKLNKYCHYLVNNSYIMLPKIINGEDVRSRY